MSDPQSSQQPQAIDTVQNAANISWERNSSMLKTNALAFNGAAAPVAFQFKTATKADFAEAMKAQHAQNQEDQVAAAAAAAAASPASPTASLHTLHPPSTLPLPLPPAHFVPPTPSIPVPASPTNNGAPVPIGNFEGSTKWAAYYNPSTQKPYFYCHALKITTHDCPADIQTQFNPAFETFLQQFRTQQIAGPPAQPPATQQNRPPPGFTLPGTATVTKIMPPPTPALPPPKPPSFGPPPTPMQLRLTPSNSSHNPNLVVSLDLDTNCDNEGYQDSQASQVTVNHMTTPVNRGPSFSFAADISNPTKIPVFNPKRSTIAESAREDLPEQHPLALVMQQSRSSAPPGGVSALALPDGGSHHSTPLTTPTNRTTFSALKSPTHQSTNAAPLLDKTVPFAELFKVDALPTQKDGTFLKLTTGFRKSWRARYVILHQGAFRWWDDLAACTKAMNQPNAVVSIVGCSAQLPPIGSHVHPKNGLYIDGNVGAIQEILDKHDSPQELEQASFFIRTDHLGEIDSWIHIMYRNGVIDARYVLNPDLTSKSLDDVSQSTHHLFEVWSRERVNPGQQSFQVTPSAVKAGSLPPPTPVNGDDPDRVSKTQQEYVVINPQDLIAAANEITTPRTNSAKGMYVPGGLYGHQPIPVPVQINNKKRYTGSYHAVLFADRIECYETYDDASLVCRYSNPDTNNSINPETLSKPKIAHLIPITRDSSIDLEKTSLTSTYNEITLKLQVKENRFRNIKKQDWFITFEECNPATGHATQITNPATVDPNKSLAETPGTSLSIAQRWFTVIEYCLEGPLSGTFGSSLWWSIIRSTLPVPLALHNCFRFITFKGLQEEGILRVPGNNQDIIKLRRTYDASQSDGVLTDPNTAAGLFKLLLRENQDGLIPRSMYKQFTSHNCRGAGAGASVEKRLPCVNALKGLIDQLPLLNHICLAYVIHTLVKISGNANVNKMFPKNCAMVLSPNLFRAPKPPDQQGLLSNDKDVNLYASPQQMAEALAEQEAVILIMIEHFAELFPRGSPFP